MFEPARHTDVINSFLTPEQHKAKHRRRKILTWTGGIALTATTLYSVDVEIHKEIATEAHVAIDIIQDEPLDELNDTQAIIFLEGFGINNARYIANIYGPIAQQLYDGQVWSVDYGNAPLDSEAQNFADAITEKAAEQGVTHIALYGHSMGGDIAGKVMAKLVEEDNVTVELAIFDKTPSGFDGLTEESKSAINGVETLNWILPDAKYSTIARVAFEASRSGGNVWQIFGRMNNPDYAGSWLMTDQALEILSADFPRQFRRVAEHRADTQQPILVYLGVGEGGHDAVVDNEFSRQQICDAARAVDLKCLSFEIPGAGHSASGLLKDAYQTVFSTNKPFIQSALDTERTRMTRVNAANHWLKKL